MARSDPKDVISQYKEAQSLRSPYENDWRVAAAHCLPMSYSSWQTDGPVMQTRGSDAARRIAYDSTGLRSLPKFASILQRIATPDGQRWHGLTASDSSLRRINRVRDYFDQLTQLLFKLRYDPRANFKTTTSEMWMSMGVYGNGPAYIAKRRPIAGGEKPGISYVSTPLRDIYALADDEGNLTTFFRRFWLNVRQFKMKFPDEKMPDAMQTESEKPVPSETRYFEFIHHVCLRVDDYDATAIDARRHPYCGSYVSVEKPEYVGEEAGYRSMPYKMPRPMTVAGSAYGFGQAMLALPSMGGASAMKKTNLKIGNKAADPVLLVHDDGVIGGTDLRPGAVNPGMVTKDGKPLMQVLPTGNFRVTEELLADERKDVEDAFFVTLFQILNETPEMTATEVMERIAEKASLLAPTMGRVQSEFLGPCIERELDIAAELGMMPQMPPELVEAGGDYEVQYTSPLAKGMYAEEVSGFMRLSEMSLGLAQATSDPSFLDTLDYDTALPEIADYMAVPARWIMSDDKKKAKRDDRQKQMEQAQLLQNAPAIASAAKTASEMGGQQSGG